MASSMAWAVCFDKLMNICDGKILTLEKEALFDFHKMFVCGFGGYILKYSGHFSGE